MNRWAVIGALAWGMLGCSGAGRYGYARTYVPLPEEAPHAQRANNDAVYDEVRRLPDRFANQTIGWFGVVTGTEDAGGGLTRVALQVRTHQDRHLCEDETEGTCRVTVNDRDGGPFSVVLRLSPEDQAGENRVHAGSLLRVFGTLVPGEYDAQGGPILRGVYYRHWPRGQYVTTAARGNWLR